MSGIARTTSPLFTARRRARRRWPAIAALLGWVLLAQTLLVVHRADHASAAHGVACALCVAADHQFGAVPQPEQVILVQTPAPLARVAHESWNPAFISAYRSRAPPEHLRA